MRSCTGSRGQERNYVVNVLDFGELPDGSTYFVMEFLDGRDLLTVMNEELLAAVHAQPAAAVTVTVPEPPEAVPTQNKAIAANLPVSRRAKWSPLRSISR